MSERKFTPGPWMMASHPSSVVGWPVVRCGPGGGRSICSISYVPGNDRVITESAANGRLIAAAPRLADSLERLLPFLDAVQDDGPIGRGWKSQELRAAIDEANAALIEAGIEP